MYDSVFVLVEAFNRIIRKKPDQFRSYTMRRQSGQGNATTKFLECNTSKGWVTQWEHGERIAKNLRKVELEGLTGDIRFNDEGKRVNYTLHVVEMTVNSAMVKVAEWSDATGITPVLAKYTRLRNHEIEKNKTYVITTMIEAPYVMLRDPDLGGKVLEGNDKYEGYCKDLADLIAKQLDINCKTSRHDEFEAPARARREKS
jgi:glutamate receptor, ionotropic, invertebrate